MYYIQLRQRIVRVRRALSLPVNELEKTDRIKLSEIHTLIRLIND